MKFFLVIASTIFLLEILLRVSDQNCYSILPIYFDNGHSSLIKNESFCVKYTGHPKSTYKTDKFGMRIIDKENYNNVNDYDNLLIGDSQAMGYGINFIDHFLYKYLDNNNKGDLQILAAPHNDIKSINFFVENNNFKFDQYNKIFIMFNLGVDLDRFVFGWKNNWNISNNLFEIKLSKFLRLYPYIKNIYLKFKRYHFTFRPSINPYLDFINDQEVDYLINSIINQYLSFLNENKILNYEFILIAPAWYIDKNQINKYRAYYSQEQFNDLKINYSYYEESMKKHIDYFKKIFDDKKIENKIIEKIILNKKDFFQKNNYHLSIDGHEQISNSL